MKLITPTLLFAAALCGLSCSQATPSTTVNRPAVAASPAAVANATPNGLVAARALYDKHCAACHGENAEGGIVKVDNKKLKVPSLKTGHAVGHPDDKLVKKVEVGGDGMPAFKDKLKAEEIQALVQLIRKEFQGK